MEKQLVATICKSPNSRSAFVDLARYLETHGALEESKSVYRGILPRSIQERYQLNGYPHGKSDDMHSCSRLGWYNPEQPPLISPLNSDPLRNSIFLDTAVNTSPEYVDLMHDCTLIYDGKNRLYLDEHGVINSEHSTMNAFLLTPRAAETAEATRLAGLSILLAARNSHNFYHWHFDCLPALALVEAAGIRISDIDHVLIDNKGPSFQMQMLRSAGFREEQIRYIDVESSHFSCENMLLVRVENQQGMAQSRRHIDWIRRTFLPPALDGFHDGDEKPGRIAIRRETRGFSNSEETCRNLEDRGYTVIQLERLPYLQQVALFHGASHVIAPHGAGLSLLAYCGPGTVVHEFYADHVQPCFWSISCALGLQYHNYNCSRITDKSITSSNKNLAARSRKTVTLTPEQLATITD